MGLEEFEPIYGSPKVEWAKNSIRGSVPLRRFLIYVYAPDYCHLKLHVSDFHCHSFEAVKSVMQLEDMRDSIGVGGSWSEFVEYLIASIKSEDVKLVLDKNCDSGLVSAKLVAQKSKGLPVISISLTNLVDSAANDVMENISFGLFNALKSMQNLRVEDQGHSSKLTNRISNEKDSGGSIQNQTEKRQKFDKINSSQLADASAALNAHCSTDLPGKQSVRSPASKTVANRVVPAYRRAKARGAFLQNNDDDDDKQN